jgi:hypothetical protein
MAQTREPPCVQHSAYSAPSTNIANHASRHSARYRGSSCGPPFRADAQQYRCITSRPLRWRRSGSHLPIQMEAPPPRQVAGPIRHPRGTGSGPRPRRPSPATAETPNRYGPAGTASGTAAEFRPNGGDPWHRAVRRQRWRPTLEQVGKEYCSLTANPLLVRGLDVATPGWGGLRCNGHRRTDGDGRRSRGPAAMNVFQGHICATMAHRQAANSKGQTRAHKTMITRMRRTGLSTLSLERALADLPSLARMLYYCCGGFLGQLTSFTASRLFSRSERPRRLAIHKHSLPRRTGKVCRRRSNNPRRVLHRSQDVFGSGQHCK